MVFQVSSQWQNFLLNQGEWRGSFTNLSPAGQELDTTASVLILEPAEDGHLVRFHLRRFGSHVDDTKPTREVITDYRTLGRQVVFFDSGSFSKGSLQLAPNTSSGAEFGFIVDDRRFRLVQLFTENGDFDGHVLIREFRAGSSAQERPVLRPDSLLGLWEGTASTITADWPVADVSAVQIQVSKSNCDGQEHLTMTTVQNSATSSISGRLHDDLISVAGPTPMSWQLFPDSGYSIVPLQVTHRLAFMVEAGWMPAHDRLERLIRRYDSTGAWHSSTHIVAVRS